MVNHTMSTPTTSSNKQKLIIVGNGMVGHHFAEQLVESGALAGFEVTIFGEERHRAYDRVHLSEYFSGRDAESLALCDADYYHTHGIQLRSGEAVTAIDREQQRVVTEQGHYAYDQLVLATGSFPFARLSLLGVPYSKRSNQKGIAVPKARSTKVE